MGGERDFRSFESHVAISRGCRLLGHYTGKGRRGRENTTALNKQVRITFEERVLVSGGPAIDGETKTTKIQQKTLDKKVGGGRDFRLSKLVGLQTTRAIHLQGGGRSKCRRRRKNTNAMNNDSRWPNFAWSFRDMFKIIGGFFRQPLPLL